MTMIRRMTIAMSGMLAALVAAGGVGIGAMAWLQSWHRDYVEAAQGTELTNNSVLQDMLNRLDNTTTVMIIVVIVVVAVAVVLGTLATVLLGRMMKQEIRGAVSSISASAAELLAVASQVAAATAQTAAATNETTATVEEVKQTAMLAQEKASEASELSQQVAGSAKNGETSSQQNRGMFERIQSDMDVVADAIDRLNEQAQSVADIITTVNDLAEQSNLLSVNASIEAAKAGEQGKGFTVVAQEVKSLAEQSKQAVAQVRGVLSEIQQASGLAVRAAEQSREAVEAGRVEAEKAIEGTKVEVGIADKAAEATLQISATSRQQLAGMEQISQAILSINEAGNQSVSGTRQVESEVRRLQDLALSLNRLFSVTSAESSKTD
jgi:methyl-accepting chemotaxis protein